MGAKISSQRNKIGKGKKESMTSEGKKLEATDFPCQGEISCFPPVYVLKQRTYRFNLSSY